VLCTSLSAVEYGQLNHVSGNEPPTIILNDGDILEVLGIARTASREDSTYVEIITDDGNVLVHASIQMDYLTRPVLYPGAIGKIVGSCTVRLRTVGGVASYVVFKLTRASEVEYKNVNIVALPTATVGAGTHEIVVEASDDQIGRASCRERV